MDHVLSVLEDLLFKEPAVLNAKFNFVQLVHHLSVDVIHVKMVTFITALKINVYHVLQLVNHANPLIFQNVSNVSLVIMSLWLKTKTHAPNVSITVQFVTMVLLVLNVPKVSHCQAIRLSAQFNARLNVPPAVKLIHQNVSLVTQELL